MSKQIDLTDIFVVGCTIALIRHGWQVAAVLLTLVMGYVIYRINLRERVKRRRKAEGKKPLPAARKSASRYDVITSDITYALRQRYPKASWLWEDPANAKQRLMSGASTEIMIWHAPINTAHVEINLRTYRLKKITFGGNHANDLDFDDYPAEKKENATVEAPVVAPVKTESEDYSYLAFEWVAGKLTELTRLVADAADEDQHYYQLRPDVLPCTAAWPDIVSELARNNFDAEILPENAGIMLNF